MCLTQIIEDLKHYKLVQKVSKTNTNNEGLILFYLDYQNSKLYNYLPIKTFQF